MYVSQWLNKLQFILWFSMLIPVKTLEHWIDFPLIPHSKPTKWRATAIWSWEKQRPSCSCVRLGIDCCFFLDLPHFFSKIVKCRASSIDSQRVCYDVISIQPSSTLKLVWKHKKKNVLTSGLRGIPQNMWEHGRFNDITNKLCLSLIRYTKHAIYLLCS